MTSEEGAMSAPVRSPPLGVRTVSYLTDLQIELSLRALQASRLLDQDLAFWSMQGLVSVDSFGCYRLELSVDLTKEEGDRMIHQLAGLGDRAESPSGSEFWKMDGELSPEYDENIDD